MKSWETKGMHNLLSENIFLYTVSYSILYCNKKGSGSFKNECLLNYQTTIFKKIQ